MVNQPSSQSLGNPLGSEDDSLCKTSVVLRYKKTKKDRCPPHLIPFGMECALSKDTEEQMRIRKWKKMQKMASPIPPFPSEVVACGGSTHSRFSELDAG